MKKSEDSSIKRQSMINFVISLTGITSFFTLNKVASDNPTYPVPATAIFIKLHQHFYNKI